MAKLRKMVDFTPHIRAGFKDFVRLALFVSLSHGADPAGWPPEVKAIVDGLGAELRDEIEEHDS